MNPEIVTRPASPETAEQEHWTARFGKPILFFIITLVVVGAYLASSIPIAVFPNTDFPRIVVAIDNGVMPIDQMQVLITRPVEEALNIVPGLTDVRSLTSRGSAEIDLFFDWSVNMFQTLDLVNAALARVQSQLPSTASVTANRLTFAAFPILGYSVVSNTIPQTRLWELATYTMKPRLNRLSGVATVVVQGGQEPEFQIQPDPAKLLKTQVTIPAILDAVAKSNILDSPGLFSSRHQLVLGMVSGQATTPGEIGNIPVHISPSGAPVRVADVGTVTPSVKPVYTIVTAEGKPAVLLNVYRQPVSNTVSVASEVKLELDALRSSLPPGIRITPFYDQSDVVNASITSVRDAILIGLVLAAIVLVVFLRDWGSSLVAGLVIPATIGITCIALHALGQSFNLMTLGGLAAAVGLVIDDAIVVVENIVLHRQSGQSRGQAIRSALHEIRVPLVGSTVTPIVVFLPLISITGVTGTFFRALAVTVGVALLTSLALALTWTPALSHYLLRSTPQGHHEETPNTGFMGRIVRLYDRTIQLVLKAPIILILASLALIAASYFCYNALGSDLLPSMDEGGFVLDYLMPAGASLEDTNRVLVGVEKILHGIPEVLSTARRTGLQLGLAAVTEANTGDISVMLKPHRSRGVDEVIGDVRTQINKQYPMLDTDFTQVLQDMIGDLTSSPDPIEVKLFSPDPNLLAQWGPKVGDSIKKLPSVVDVKNGIEDTVSGPAVVWSVDPATAARAGFTPQEIELDASAMLDGEPAPTPIVISGRAYTLRVRFPESSRQSLENIQNTLLVSGTGRTATLGTLASLQNIPGQTEIRRENLQRDIAVTGRLQGLNLGAGVAEVKKAVAALHIPPSIRVEYGGTYATQQKSFHDLVIVLALAVVLVFIVLLIEFRSFAAPIAILASALLSTSGVFLALFITGTTFNLSSFMGLIMVIGIVAKNGILLLDAEQRFHAEGASPRQAMIHAGERRLRPIIMTALATVAGMIPLSLAIGAGSQMLQPLAIAVIGGIAASLLLSLIVTPVVHYYVSGSARA
ncbi:MAG TPA: efflux RND transporter permease subunit [Bryobacteraceae bacterium]|jgi:CzcA family heavy metal efflux pump|nr:efflux RND transporter permease subunit [Bryobacteraceae bacterium]